MPNLVNINHCPFCDLRVTDDFRPVISNKEVNSYIIKASQVVDLKSIISRTCLKCPRCHTQFYKNSFSINLLKHIYSTPPVHHNAGWSRFQNRSAYLNSYELIAIENYLKNILSIKSINLYSELNCPFQGLALQLDQESNRSTFFGHKKVLTTIPSHEMWSNDCTSNSHDNSLITCRESCLRNNIFYSSKFLYSKDLLNIINEEQKHGISLMFLSNCLDHIPNPLIHLSYIVLLFDVTIIRIHQYNPLVGPSMQHIMSIGDKYAEWSKLMNMNLRIYDISDVIKSKKNDRYLVIIKK